MVQFNQRYTFKNSVIRMQFVNLLESMKVVHYINSNTVCSDYMLIECDGVGVDIKGIKRKAMRSRPLRNVNEEYIAQMRCMPTKEALLQFIAL